ncbi:hypothetical protein DOK78_000742 [Enterococcus sp. DIV2402]|uniref:Uncharacterized protein n=1 Tax=Candidatus Enterococcus lowellii TaxID=2230877 RepID=A0ABZ2SJU0_9ENTE|nr:hypothetical protein [Enterococcus sp. DIV2402]MBO0465462.1 hypothetical protein [Enterococcus sp. DIV2402]
MKKNIWGFIIIVALICGGIFLYLSSTPKESIDVTRLPSEQVTVFTYEIKRPKDQDIYLNDRYFGSESETPRLDTVSFVGYKEQIYHLTFTTSEDYKSLSIRLAKADTGEPYTETTHNIEDDPFSYVAFLPFEKVKPDNVIGVVVSTKNPETLEKMQKNPEKARNYIKKYDRIYQQVVVIN